MMNDSFLTIEKVSEGLYKEKGSKFIGLLFPVTSEAEIKKLITQVKKEHHAARHWCYAYRLGADKKLIRANDDGEPSGTAGKPILNQLAAADLTNVLLIVVRYFGGTLLGTSGLVNAYKNSASDAIQKAAIITKYITLRAKVIFNTENTNEVMRRLKEYDAEIIDHAFKTQNELIFSMRISCIPKCFDLFKQQNIHSEIIEKNEPSGF